jgi:transcriptional regulator with XRE-family HTH domain
MANQFGEALRERRRTVGMSQRELADKIDVDFSYISKVETGKLPPPSADKIVEICLVLEIEPSELLALTGKLPTNVQKAVGTSEVAQEFLQEAQRMALSEDEWKNLVRSLRKLRD